MRIRLPNAASLANEALDLAHHRNLDLPKAEGIKSKKGEVAFSLMEVMIAIAIFFTASFVILALVSSGLKTARLLRNDRPSCGIIAAELTSSNGLEEGHFSDDFGKLYPGYSYEYDVASSDIYTGMVSVVISINRQGQRTPESTMEILRFDPNFKSKRLGLQP